MISVFQQRSQPPRLLANISCQYVIEWETDHACPEHAVLGDAEECRLHVDGNLIDLKRLRNPKGTVEILEWTSSLLLS